MTTPAPHDPRPSSDVSAGVGLAGLAGLFVWLMICRDWASVADALSIPGPRAPLAGPNAALLAVVFSGIPMILWSLLVDKVHRRPSTGIDWTAPRPVSAIVDISITKLAGLWATWALIGFCYFIARWYWNGQYVFAMDVIGTAAAPLFVLSVPYVLWLDRVLIDPRDAAWHFGALLIGHQQWSRDEVWQHLRAWGVKGFFCAFMISILPPGFAALVTFDLTALGRDPIVITRWLTELLFLIDVQIAMVGYLVTMKPLDAQIRSANPYLAGWIAALMCYPPFLLMSDGGVMDYHPGTADWAYWLQYHPALLWAWGGLLVILTGIYAWATVAFGIRFSNLTYRGVLTNGPYRFTRHPAYLSKNLFWWASTLPFLVTSGSVPDMVRNTVLLAMVSAVYYWRARTEERHLLGEDAKYRAYYDWMARNAVITRGLGRLGAALRPRGESVAAAE